MRLVETEMRRALHRRAVRTLVAVGLLGCVLAGVVAFAGSHGKSLVELRLADEGSPALLADWWDAGEGDGFLAMSMIFLVLGGLFGGATVAGAEWRAGTVTTVLTWEPRRLRLHGARTASAAVLAFAISLGLQALFLASFLPAVLANGSTDGASPGFWTDLAVAMVRTSAVTAAAAVVAIALATLARNTAFAVILAFAWMAVVESVLRAVEPALRPWLWGENLVTVLAWHRVADDGLTRGPGAALATLVVYCVVLVGAASWSFQRRDIVAST